MANLFAADGAVSPASAAAPAQDARQRVDPMTAVAIPATNRRGFWIVNRSDRAGSTDGAIRSSMENSTTGHSLVLNASSASWMPATGIKWVGCGLARGEHSNRVASTLAAAVSPARVPAIRPDAACHPPPSEPHEQLIPGTTAPTRASPSRGGVRACFSSPRISLIVASSSDRSAASIAASRIDVCENDSPHYVSPRVRDADGAIISKADLSPTRLLRAHPAVH